MNNVMHQRVPLKTETTENTHGNKIHMCVCVCAYMCFTGCCTQNLSHAKLYSQNCFTFNFETKSHYVSYAGLALPM